MFWAMQGKQLPITGDGTETRDWTFVEDIINGLLSMGIRKEAIGESINLGSGKETRVIDMANMVNDITNNKSGIVFVERRNWDVKTRLLSSIDKAKKLIEYNPNTSFNDGIKRVHEWFADNFENIKKSADF